MGGNFSAELLKVRNKEVADLSNHNLGKVPTQIGSLKKAQQLNLSVNGLSELPPEVGRPFSVSDGGPLYGADFYVGKLRQLKILNISDNAITSFPTEIGQLSRLTHLYAG